jgi:hypothetical protein
MRQANKYKIILLPAENTRTIAKRNKYVQADKIDYQRHNINCLYGLY